MRVRACAAFLILLAVAGKAEAPEAPDTTTPPAEPATPAGIPFSHAQHAGTHRLDCLLCHGQAATEAEANIPSARDCYVCHWSIAADRPAILELERQVSQRVALHWPAQVRLPAHVRFRHDPHVRAGIDCARCHGQVAEMAEVRPVQPLTMGFCVDCHRTEGATHDCMACHQ